MREAVWAAGMAIGALAMFVARGSAGAARSPVFVWFVAGQAVFLGCGSGLFIQLYGRLLRVVKRPVLQEPLAAMTEHRRLLVALHVVVFGALIVFTAAALVNPGAQAALQGAVKKQAATPNNPLALAAAAYRSKSVPVAAVTTLAVNFLFGAVLVVTVPSLVLPGIGVLIVTGRACILGLALAPTSQKLLHAMAWHTGTVLVEMEAYILAAFYGLMVPVYLLSASKGERAGERYRKAAVLNAKGALLVLIVLAVAALYESVEVIAQMP
jgi:hypothetical protein